MLDVDQLKVSLDLRAIARQELGEPRFKSGKCDAYKCPFHHERKGQSLVIYADGWKCYGACGTGGDAIAFIQRLHNLSFKQAVEYLGGNTLYLTNGGIKRRPREETAPDPAAPPSAEWQHFARAVLDFAESALWDSPLGEKALDYLTRRGIHDLTIQTARLGYIPARDDGERTYGRVMFDQWRKADGKPVRVPCGIVIPHFADGHLWALRVRRAVGDPKYMGVAGGSKALYWSDAILRGLPVLIVEGEFDALTAWQCACDLVSPVAIASASNADINPYWFPKLIAAPRILARMDDDGGGNKALPKLAALSQCVAPCQVPQGKDVNEFYVMNGFRRDPIRQWILEVCR
ncbi:MAG: hypothetical protein IH587_02610 [Anaerolineae bacterium]|nr:hypothetical protein [Anaerolineae bacterium]